MGAAEVFSPILASIQAQPAVLRRAAYETALRRHDWEFERSDDARAYRAGREVLVALRAEQLLIDADGAIWNSIAPEGHRIEVVA